MNVGADGNTFLLAWLCCVECMAVERHKFEGQKTQNIDRSFEQYPTGILSISIFYVQPSKETVKIVGQKACAIFSLLVPEL